MVVVPGKVKGKENMVSGAEQDGVQVIQTCIYQIPAFDIDRAQN
jgi:hypothetical protein